MSELALRYRLPWSTTEFAHDAVSDYALDLLLRQTQKGVAVAALLILVLELIASGLAIVAPKIETGSLTVHLALCALCITTCIAVRAVKDLCTLHLLGIVQLTLTGAGYIFIGAASGNFNIPVTAGIVLLFSVVPLVPWALREALAVAALIYAVFTLSTLGVPERFETGVLLQLQVLMLTTAVCSCVIVAQSTTIRRNEILNRFELENAQRNLRHQALHDPLTGVGNRRLMENEFHALSTRMFTRYGAYHFALVDVDDLKRTNDAQGHGQGDALLRHVADTLVRAVADNGLVVRIGGDEFAALFAGQPTSEASAWIAASARQAGPGIGLSIGLVTVTDRHPQALTCCYREADRMQYIAKGRKKHQPGIRVEHEEIVTSIPYTPQQEEGVDASAFASTGSSQK